jgi:predicted phage terminase large subunit-like protein
MPVRFNGKLSPLPDNYFELSPSGQRDARINAVRLVETPADVVKGWDFFRRYYLQAEGDFYKRRLPSPSIHYTWIWCMANYARNIFAAPRSYAKSIVVGTEWPMFQSLARPGTDSLIIVANDDFAKDRGQRLMEQFARNDRLREDFGDLIGKPRSDGRQWNFHTMNLLNRSKIRFMSFGSRHLGARPDLIIWDDLEPDPQQVRDWESIVDDLINGLFNVFLPMLDGGTQMSIIGTLLHRRSFLYWAITSTDRRLGYWNRMLTAIVDREGNPTWKEKFNKTTIERLRKELGPSAFSAQYMNNPISDSDQTLDLHLRRNMYTVDVTGDEFSVLPLESESTLVHWTCKDMEEKETSPDWDEIRRPFGRTVSKWYRFITVDSAQETHQNADYSVVMVMAVDPDDCLWVLDMWAGREGLGTVCDQIWTMAYKWKVKLIGIERIGAYQSLYEKAVGERSEIERKMGWMPGIMPIKYPAHLNKESRMGQLEWRFKAGRVKILDSIIGPWKMLRHQIEAFTPDLANLKHDDALDALSMHGYVMRPRTRQIAEGEEDNYRKTFAQRLCDGELLHPATGIPYITGMNSDEIPVHALLERQEDASRKGQDEKPRIELPRGTFTMLDVARTLSKGGDEWNGGR